MMPNPECVHCYVTRSQETRIKKLEAEREVLLSLIPHNDVYDESMTDIDLEDPVSMEFHGGVDPKPFGNWGYALNPEPCRRCLAELEEAR